MTIWHSIGPDPCNSSARWHIRWPDHVGVPRHRIMICEVETYIIYRSVEALQQAHTTPLAIWPIVPIIVCVIKKPECENRMQIDHDHRKERS